MESRKYPVVSVTKTDDGTIAESHALWNDPSRRRYADGFVPSRDFDVRGVRDTFQGQLCGLLNRINRKMQFHFHGFLRACRDPLAKLDGTIHDTSVTLVVGHDIVGIACRRSNVRYVEDQRGFLRRLIGMVINLRKYGSFRHPASRYWD